MAKIRDRNHTAVCDCTVIHDVVVEKVKTLMPSSDRLFDLAEFFKILGDSTRIGILSALHKSEMCVCDISSLLDMTQSAVSHQLRILKQVRLVRSRKEGKIVYYKLDDSHIEEILSMGFKHISES
jgi:ArsR family transcriptional regulator, lead/cadmium/zinc/bismuth-responsive transcriptional repressor